MQHKSDRDILKVKDILQAINFIYTFVEKENLESFTNNYLIQSAVIRQFEIIGEAGGKISSETQKAFPDIPWPSIRAFRNLLIHQYYKVDATEVWVTIQNDLGKLEEQMKSALNYLQLKNE